jgi:hypothetical protein
VLRQVLQVDAVAGGLFAHPFEPLAEPSGGLAERGLRIDVQPPAERGDGEQEVAQLFLDPLGGRSAGNLGFELGQLLPNLLDGPFGRTPVEP